MSGDERLDAYRRAGAVAREAREYGASLIKPGAPMLDVAEAIETLIIDRGARLAFPVNLAIDDVAAHYTPTPGDTLRFQTGQLVKLDVGAHIDGCIADTAVTVEVGTNRWSQLVEASRAALDAALDVLKPRLEMRHVGAAVERVIGARGFVPISNLTGHSVGPYDLHAGVSVPNVDDDSDDALKAGDVVAVEPFATNGAGKVVGRKNSNIYRLLRALTPTDAAEYPVLVSVQDEFRQLPFSERWCAKIDAGASKQLAKAVRRGLVSYYPMLVEARGGMVSQAEHTVIMADGGIEVIT